MTEMPSYVVENPSFEPNKPPKKYSTYTSLLPILLSILTYILFFNVLNLSPSSIFNDTKILFFISNALILIIAADYGAFAEKENHDFYGEYTAVMRSDARENPRPENSGYEVSLAEEIKKREKQEAIRAIPRPRYMLHQEAEVPKKTVQVVSENQPRNRPIEKYEPTTDPDIHIAASKGETCRSSNPVSPKPYGRSKSDKARSERRRQDIKHRPNSYDRSQSESSNWMVVHKGKKAEEKWENVREESEEFARMSNEELNRRVEDFIQRFNRDIKRQSSLI